MSIGNTNNLTDEAQLKQLMDIWSSRGLGYFDINWFLSRNFTPEQFKSHLTGNNIELRDGVYVDTTPIPESKANNTKKYVLWGLLGIGLIMATKKLIK